MKAFRATTSDLEESAETVNPTEVRWKRQRTFAVAFVKSHRLEVAIDLLRRVDHPLLRNSFNTTKKVITHRLTLERVDHVDDTITALVHEAYDTVGPGTR